MARTWQFLDLWTLQVTWDNDFCAFTFLCHRREGLESTWGMSNRKNLIVERTCFRLQVDVLYSQSPNDNVVSASATYNRLLFLPQSQAVSLPEDMNKHSAFSSWWRNRPLLSSSCYIWLYDSLLYVYVETIYLGALLGCHVGESPATEGLKFTGLQCMKNAKGSVCLISLFQM